MTTQQRLFHRAWVLVALAIIALGLGPALPVAHAQSLTLDNGHVDAFNVTADGGTLNLDLKEDVTGSHERHAPEEVLLVVKEEALTDVTTQISEIGTSTYYLPQTQDPNLLWPGWDTQEVTTGGFSAIDIEFLSVSGPGQVFMFETAGFGSLNSVLTSGSFELTNGSVVNQENPAHRHVNWAFSAPGTYTMQVRATGDGQSSNTATYTWQVGDGSAAPSPAAPNTAPSDSNVNAPANAAPAPGANAVAPQNQQCVPDVIPKVKDDREVPAVWRSPSELTFALGDAARIDLPQSIGPVAAGPVWMIGSTQKQGVPWLGANTMSPSMLEHTEGGVTWSLTGFEGPGQMVVYSQGNLGKVVGEEWFRGSDTRAEGSHTIPANSHVHPNWVFSAPGTYKVTISQTATLKDGRQVSGQDTLTFIVGSSEGNATDGHFDLGADVDPAGGACAGTAAGVGAAGTGSGAESRPALANTGNNYLSSSILILGLGLVALGAATVYLLSVISRRSQG